VLHAEACEVAGRQQGAHAKSAVNRDLKGVSIPAKKVLPNQIAGVYQTVEAIRVEMSIAFEPRVHFSLIEGPLHKQGMFQGGAKSKDGESNTEKKQACAGECHKNAHDKSLDGIKSKGYFPYAAKREFRIRYWREQAVRETRVSGLTAEKTSET
jgi:hypothetical protein